MQYRISNFHLPALLIAFSPLLPAQGQLYRLGAEATSNSAYGQAVADAGDVDADGIPDLAVGAPFFSVAGMTPGAVFVYPDVAIAHREPARAARMGCSGGCSGESQRVTCGDVRPQVTCLVTEVERRRR
jgi:hypothetical protein